MQNANGTPIWYELITGDPDAAERFYSAVTGWTYRKPGGGLERDYRIVESTEDGIAGLMKAEGAMPRGWLAYFAADVDDDAARVSELGGTVHMGPMDIPNVGRFAFATDPAGAPFCLMRGFSDEPSRAFEPTTPGHGAWNELVTPDQDAAFSFYGSLFGWQRGDVMPMGEAGDYTFIDHDGSMLGAMMNTNGNTPKARWQTYFRVPDIDAATSAVTENGGTLVNGPAQVPGGDYVIQTTDPEGNFVGFVGARRS
ncbi:VOC family protein [Pararhizobium mangrovi]|uniref:VOC family protein n=1 Tax=Pararhizobium mangrovi TaxID=2590452 RepID=A0A506U3I2_9HYPH|nr:VOC family protein [Pararhizobium mangrovi]TPW26447.1 VOC family protein [Pararhizobium mangrovi]